MTELEKKKYRVELMKVQAAKAQMELNILEKENDIERILKSIEAQEARIEEIEEIIKED